MVTIAGLSLADYCRMAPPPALSAPKPAAGSAIRVTGAVTTDIPPAGGCIANDSGFLALFHGTSGAQSFRLFVNLGTYDGPGVYVLRNGEDAGPVGWSITLDLEEPPGQRSWGQAGAWDSPVSTSQVTVNEDEQSGRIEADLINANGGTPDSGDGTIVHAEGDFTCTPIDG
jgi:hypothetical protein